MTHFEVTFPVRYYETDQMAVVHHSNYIRYFEIARNAMMVEWGFPIERCEGEYGVMIPIVSVECRFKHPARMGDVLTAVAEIDRTPLAKLEKDLAYQQKFLAGVRGKLANERFVANAPAAVIENERKKEADSLSKIESLQAQLNALKNN